MSRRSQAIRTARHAKLERRRLATFPQPRNEKTPTREHRGLDFAPHARLSCEPSRAPWPANSRFSSD